MIYAKSMRVLIPFFCGCAMLYAAVTGFISPYYNWDMLGYVGSVTAWQEKDSHAIYVKTMATVKENIPGWIYQDYISNPLSAEDKAFVQELPFYQVKPLYNGLIWLVHQTGIALPPATWIISATSFTALALLLFLWPPSYMAREIWLLLVVALTYLWPWPMASLARLSTPDSICTLLTTAVLYSWLVCRSFPLFFALCCAAVLARPDALIFCSALAVYFSLFSPARNRMSIYSAASLVLLLCATYIATSRLAHNYGLERWFIFTFIEKVPYPAEVTRHLTPELYWEALSPSAILFLSLGRTMAMLTVSLLACICHYLKPAEGNRLWLHLLLLAWGCITVRFLMFPAWGEDRYYFCYYLPILFASGELITPYLAALWRLLQTHRQKIR
jgi:hypothetical protein